MFSRLYIFVFLFLAGAQAAHTQQGTRTISGLVTSEDSAPLEGVSVSIKGTNNTSGTQSDGIYYISVKDKDSVLVFSHAECETREIKLNGAGEYNVVLPRKTGISVSGPLSPVSAWVWPLPAKLADKILSINNAGT